MKPKIKSELDNLRDKGDAFMDAIPEGYKALLVFVDTKGRAHMASSCCDQCGLGLARAAVERFGMDCDDPGPPLLDEEVTAMFEGFYQSKH